METTAIAPTTQLHVTKVNNWRRFSRIRTHALHLGSSTLYVNAYYLAEISKFFEKLFFENFKEAKEQSAELPDEEPDDVIEFLSVVTDTHLSKRKDITEQNCGLMMRYADIWAVQSLRDRCEEFMLEKYPFLKSDFNSALIIASMATQHNFSRKTLENAISRLAYFGTDALIQANVFDMITDTRVIATLFASTVQLCNESEPNHSWLETDRRPRECAYLKCSSQMAICPCVHCGLSFCPEHKNLLPCPHSAKSLFATHIAIGANSSAKSLSRSTPDDSNTATHLKVVGYREGFAKLDSRLLQSTSSD
uniref:BTB domain-containing protein n=1 Tax=Syphacia muris TaxID=451379 RepID=A0A0N5AQ47_9BILA